ncbi:hypothetical protein ALC57_08558 [Trachymyrmex cornetzi]|uniref:Uncharacterized protein n=1 Tax=Trachymyrmex cornetzi TaxID=471704 RepID=A0A151J753_9HYME|nr:hypothetical protein ALC57_08558 [Trachymyrmex cornetzi]
MMGYRGRLGGVSGGDGKRKRDGSDEGDEGGEVDEKQIFGKSRKTGRSPIKNVTGEEGRISDILKGWREEMRERWDWMEDKLGEIRKELRRDPSLELLKIEKKIFFF